MSELFEYSGFEVHIDTDVMTPALIWESRHEEWSRKMASNEIYENFSDEEREVIVEKIRAI